MQCVFTDLDRAMLCEAASGAFLDPKGAPRTMVLHPIRIAMLAALGFSTDGRTDNFKLRFRLADPPNLDLVAKRMLAALYFAYDVHAATPLRIEAPDAPDLADGATCGPTA